MAAAGVGHDADPLARPVAVTSAPTLLDRADELVAQHDALPVGQLAVAVADDLHVGAADRGRADPQQQAVAAALADRGTSRTANAPPC